MTHLSLDWTGDMTFRNSEGSPAIALESSNPAIASPPQALGYAVMACMGMDVVHVLQKGRQDLRAMTIRFEGQRAHEHPRRFIAMRVRFVLTGKVDGKQVARAIELSRTKYCSVWNSIRPDVELETGYEILND
jgi:putative redox protein